MKTISLTLYLQSNLHRRIYSLLCIFVILALIPWIVQKSSFLLQVLTISFLYATLSLSWNLLATGGDISLGHAAFFGIGAYGSSILALNFDLTPLITMWVGGLMAALVALACGVLLVRLKGAYFALGTLAIIEIPKMIAENCTSWTRGSLGLLNIPPFEFIHPVTNSYTSTYLFYYLVLLTVFVLIFLVMNSRWGWALNALRQDEKVCMAIGIDTRFYRLLTIATSGFIAGICGAIYAHSMGIIEPGMVFNIHYSALPMVMSFFGGRYSVLGPVAGAITLFSLDQFLFLPLFPAGHQILYGLAIMLTILFMPKGIMGYLSGKYGTLRT